MNVRQIAQKAKSVARQLAGLDHITRTSLLKQMDDALHAARAHILSENVRDVEHAAKTGLSMPLQDRLKIDGKRFDAMLKGLREVAAQHDPLGEVIEKRSMPNGLRFTKVRVPIGVVGMIYESR